MKRTKKIDDEFGTICICAERYAIGRQSYMPSLVASFIKRNIDDIDTRAVAVMIRDINAAEDMGYGYGDSKIDKPIWMDLLEFLKKERDNRNEI